MSIPAIQMPQQWAQGDRLIRLPEVENLTGYKKSTLYNLMNRGDFPQPVRITQRAVLWPESIVMKWVQDRINGVPLGSNSKGGL